MRNIGANRVLAFDGFEVDLDAATILVDGAVKDVEPQVYELIAFLVAHRGRLVPTMRSSSIWKGRFISDAAIATRINAARKALGDDGARQR